MSWMGAGEKRGEIARACVHCLVLCLTVILSIFPCLLAICISFVVNFLCLSFAFLLGILAFFSFFQQYEGALNNTRALILCLFCIFSYSWLLVLCQLCFSPCISPQLTSVCRHQRHVHSHWELGSHLGRTLGCASKRKSK